MSNFKDRTTTTTTTTTHTTTTVMVSSIKSCSTHETNLNDQGGRGKISYFDRHDVQCPANTAMKGWHLSRAGTKTKIQFVYECCEMEEGVLGECTEESTQLKDAGKQHRLYFMNRHNIK